MKNIIGRHEATREFLVYGCPLDTIAAIAVVAGILGAATSGILNNEAGITLGAALAIAGIWAAHRTRAGAWDLMQAYRGKATMEEAIARARARGGQVDELESLKDRISESTARIVGGSAIALLIGALIGMLATGR